MDLLAAYDLGRTLMAEHGIDDWTLGFDTAKRRAGMCQAHRRHLSLSAPLTRIHSEAEVHDTLLHEIAHALAGPEHGHDAHWQAIARSIGSTGARCVPEDAPRLPADWVGVCPAGHVSERHRRPERVASCPRCDSTFNAAHLFEWTFRGRPARHHPNYLAELEALRRGARPTRTGPGGRVRITASGEFHGQVGVVAKVGRTRYHVRLGRRVVTVPFALAQPVRG